MSSLCSTCHHYSKIFALLLTAALISGCNNPVRTPTPQATDSPPPTSAVETASPVVPTTIPATQTPAASPTPAALVIGPDNLDQLESTHSVTTAEAGFMTWVADDALAAASELKIEIFQVEALQRTAEIASGERPTVLAASPDLQLLAWGGYDSHQLYLLDINSQTEAQSLASLESPITSLAFSPNGEILAAASYDNVIYMYNTTTGEEIDQWQFPSWITDLTFSPDGSQLAGVESEAFTVHIWDAVSGEELNQLLWADHAAPVLYGVKFSPDWTRVAWIARGTVLIMDMSTGAEITYLGHEDFVNDSAWSHDGRLFVTSAAATVGGNFSPVLIWWDPVSGEKLDTLVTTVPTMRMEFSPDGGKLATLHQMGVIQIWSIQP